MAQLKCEMSDDCPKPVTHIGIKGYVYCADHGVQRREYGWERTRKMTAAELRTVASGRAIKYRRP